MNLVTTKIYLHSNKEAMYEVGIELGLSPKALAKFCYTAYEVEVTLRVDKKTGVAYATHLNGTELGDWEQL